MKPLLEIATSLSIAAAAALLSAACAPKIYVIDRQTILEQEAAGEWPEFDRELVQSTIARGPEPLGSTPPSPSEKRVYEVLNGELVAEEADSRKQTVPNALKPSSRGNKSETSKDPAKGARQ